MKCLKCGYEMPELTMYCPQCGAPQYGVKEKNEVHLELTDPMKSSVVVTGYTNLTNALTALKRVLDADLKDVRALLSELPCTVCSGLSEEQAELISADLTASGILTEVRSSSKPAPPAEPDEETPAEEEKPEEETAEEKPSFEEEMEAFLQEEPVPEAPADEAPAEEMPAEEKTVSDAEFEAQMAEFLNSK